MARVITAPGIVRNVSKYLNSMRRVPFAIGKDDWTEVDSSTYTYEFVTTYVTASSFDIGTFDNSVRNYAKGDINMEKKDGGGGMVFTTTKRPTGTVSGSIYIWDNNDNKVPVILEDTVVPIENGGTGTTSVPGILSTLGLGSANDAQETLDFGDAVHEDVANNVTTTSEGYVLDARQGKVLKDSVDALNSNFTSMRYNELTSGSLKTWVANTAQEGFTCFRYNASVTDVPCTYGQGYCVKYNNNLRIVVFDMASVAQYTCYKPSNSSTWSNWNALNDYLRLDGNETGTTLNGTTIETNASYTRCVVKNGWVNLKIRFGCPTISAGRTAIYQLANKIIPPCDFGYIWAHGEWDESIQGQMTISSDGKIYAQTNCSGKSLTLRATYPVLY